MAYNTLPPIGLRYLLGDYVICLCEYRLDSWYVHIQSNLYVVFITISIGYNDSG